PLAGARQPAQRAATLTRRHALSRAPGPQRRGRSAKGGSRRGRGAKAGWSRSRSYQRPKGLRVLDLRGTAGYPTPNPSADTMPHHLWRSHMSVLKRRALIGPLAVLLLLAACQTAGESPGASPGAEWSGASPSEGAAGSPVANVPDDQLTVAGHLTACIDIPYPPQEFFDEQGNPTGPDPDITP